MEKTQKILDLIEKVLGDISNENVKYYLEGEIAEIVGESEELSNHRAATNESR